MFMSAVLGSLMFLQGTTTTHFSTRMRPVGSTVCCKERASLFEGKTTEAGSQAYYLYLSP